MTRRASGAFACRRRAGLQVHRAGVAGVAFQVACSNPLVAGSPIVGRQFLIVVVVVAALAVASCRALSFRIDLLLRHNDTAGQLCGRPGLINGTSCDYSPKS